MNPKLLLLPVFLGLVLMVPNALTIAAIVCLVIALELQVRLVRGAGELHQPRAERRRGQEGRVPRDEGLPGG